MVDFDFFEALEVSHCYEAEPQFSEVFHVFAEKINSLMRYHHFAHQYFHRYLSEEKSLVDKAFQGESSENYDEKYDFYYSDNEFIPEIVNFSTIAQLMTLLETMLNDIAKEISGEPFHHGIANDNKKPAINNIINLFQHEFDLRIRIDDATWDDLHKLRKIRNQYIHKMDKTLFENIKTELNHLYHAESDEELDKEFVHLSFKTISNVAKSVELAYLKYRENKK